VPVKFESYFCVGGNFYGEKSFVELWDVKEVKEL
jgi:hypothetical protein